MPGLLRKIAFLEDENRELQFAHDNLKETLSINKNILNGILSGELKQEQILFQL